MRKSIVQQLFIYFLMISLVITLGMYVQPIKHVESQHVGSITAISAEAAADTLPAVEIKPIVFTQTVPSYPPSTIVESKTEPKEEPAAPLPATKEELPAFEVTAYYLNVRSEPNAESSIMMVAEQGNTFEIVSELENGWLALKEGGFIHGGYAKRVEKEAIDNSDVTLVTHAPKKVTGAVRIASSENIESKDTDQENIIKTVQNPGKPTARVDSKSGLTAAHIAKIFEGTALSGHGLEEAILEIEDEYGINAFFTIAVMKLESGNGKSKIAKNKNNLFGLNALDGDAYNKAFSFKTKGDSVRRFGQLIYKHYVKKGLETIDQVAKKYCPANSKWSPLVMKIMKSDYKKV